MSVSHSAATATLCRFFANTTTAIAAADVAV